MRNQVRINGYSAAINIRAGDEDFSETAAFAIWQMYYM